MPESLPQDSPSSTPNYHHDTLMCLTGVVGEPSMSVTQPNFVLEGARRMHPWTEYPVLNLSHRYLSLSEYRDIVLTRDERLVARPFEIRAAMRKGQLFEMRMIWRERIYENLAHDLLGSELEQRMSDFDSGAVSDWTGRYSNRSAPAKLLSTSSESEDWYQLLSDEFEQHSRFSNYSAPARLFAATPESLAPSASGSDYLQSSDAFDYFFDQSGEWGSEWGPDYSLLKAQANAARAAATGQPEESAYGFPASSERRSSGSDDSHISDILAQFLSEEEKLDHGPSNVWPMATRVGETEEVSGSVQLLEASPPTRTLSASDSDGSQDSVSLSYFLDQASKWGPEYEIIHAQASAVRVAEDNKEVAESAKTIETVAVENVEAKTEAGPRINSMVNLILGRVNSAYKQHETATEGGETTGMEDDHDFLEQKVLREITWAIEQLGEDLGETTTHVQVEEDLGSLGAVSANVASDYASDASSSGDSNVTVRPLKTTPATTEESLVDNIICQVKRVIAEYAATLEAAGTMAAEMRKERRKVNKIRQAVVGLGRDLLRQLRDEKLYDKSDADESDAGEPDASIATAIDIRKNTYVVNVIGDKGGDKSKNKEEPSAFEYASSEYDSDATVLSMRTIQDTVKSKDTYEVDVNRWTVRYGVTAPSRVVPVNQMPANTEQYHKCDCNRSKNKTKCHHCDETAVFEGVYDNLF